MGELAKKVTKEKLFRFLSLNKRKLRQMVVSEGYVWDPML